MNNTTNILDEFFRGHLSVPIDSDIARADCVVSGGAQYKMYEFSRWDTEKWTRCPNPKQDH